MRRRGKAILFSLLRLTYVGALSALVLLIVLGEPSTHRIKEVSTSPDGQYTALASIRLPWYRNDEMWSSNVPYSLSLRQNLGESAGEETEFFQYTPSGNLRPEFKFAWHDDKNLEIQYRGVCLQERAEEVGDLHIQYRKMPGWRPNDPNC